MNAKLRAVFILLALTGAIRAARAQTIFVDTANDVVDFEGAQMVANLPGPDGKVSLPEAALASDNTPGIQTIGFHIPQNEWLYQQFFPGRAVLKPFLGLRVFDTAILDARTQTAFTGETNLEGGGEVVIWHETYLIDNVGGAVFGFDNSSIHLSGGSNNVIQGNTKTGVEVFDSAFNLIGGTNPGQGNTGGFVQIDRASNNVVVGNTLQRVRVLGWIANGQPAENNRIGGPTPAERNYITGLGTWNSEGWPSGFAVQLFNAIGTVVENNQIGTTPDGLQQGHLATTAGVYFDDENYDTTIRGNRIAGILGHRIGPYPGVLGAAIAIGGFGSGIEIVGNTIGLDANGAPLLGSVTGIATANYYVGPVQNVSIGGSAAGEGNVIAGHLATGISVANTLAGVRILGNSIHDNGSLGIDLITNAYLTGVTPNDALDADTGGNGLQNFAVIQSAASTGNTLRVVGTLNSSASSNFAIEFFASPQCDASGFGEGQNYLGSTAVSTDSSGSAAFDVTLSASVAQGWFVSSTATSVASASTSEFSACVVVTAGEPPAVVAFCFGDGSLPTACPCVAPNTVPSPTAAPGRGCANSLNLGGALLNATGTTAPDTLVFSAFVSPTYVSFGVLLKGDAQASAGIASADGVRCVDGQLIRFGAHNAATNGASQGFWTYPNTVQTIPVSVQTGQPPAQTAYYQLFYRNNAANFCTAATTNWSNGIQVAWQ